jgi:hypothetical protein
MSRGVYYTVYGSDLTERPKDGPYLADPVIKKRLYPVFGKKKVVLFLSYMCVRVDLGYHALPNDVFTWSFS